MKSRLHLLTAREQKITTKGRLANMLYSPMRYSFPEADCFYPLIGKPIKTPRGIGTIVQAFENRITVIINNKTHFRKPKDLLPTPAQNVNKATHLDPGGQDLVDCGHEHQMHILRLSDTNTDTRD